MKIAILGSGVVGQIIAEKLTKLGHEVMIGTRNKEKLLDKADVDTFGRPPFKDWHKQNQAVKLGLNYEAAIFGELVVNATSGVGSLEALKMAGIENLKGKVLLDIANPLDFSQGMPPSLTICNTDSLGEQIQRKFPDIKVVKSLNTMNAYLMVNPRLLPEEQTVFLSGNDTQAKETIKKLLGSFGWKENEMIDLGDISTSRGTEQLLPIWARLYGVLNNPMFNFKIVVGQNPQV